MQGPSLTAWLLPCSKINSLATLGLCCQLYTHFSGQLLSPPLFFFFFKFKLNRMGEKSWMMSVLAVAFQCSPSLGGGCEGPEPTFPPEVARTTQADAFTPTATGCSPVCWIPISIPDPRQSLRCLALPAKPKSRGSFQCLPTERPRLHFPPEAPSGGRFEAKSQNVSVE